MWRRKQTEITDGRLQYAESPPLFQSYYLTSSLIYCKIPEIRLSLQNPLSHTPNPYPSHVPYLSSQTEFYPTNPGHSCQALLWFVAAVIKAKSPKPFTGKHTGNNLSTGRLKSPRKHQNLFFPHTKKAKW
jgi:hypothetical protein